MATEAVVSFVVERLGNLLIEEAQLLLGVHDEVRLIERELRRMQCFLKDADAKQKGDARVRNLVAEIRDLSYDADDIIDTFTLSQAAKIARRRRGVLIGGLSPQQMSEWKTRYKVGKEIRQLKLKIAEISKSLVDYGIKDINDQAGGQDARLGERRLVNAKFEEKNVVGFKKEITILKERLINGESRRSVISLVGMGGTGKTTLAKKIYRDVKNDFDCHAFIYLSQQYAIKDVLICIIKCTMSLPRDEIKKLNDEDLEDLGEKLSAFLSGKRYLVVIDDIWTAEAWEILKRILPDDSNKSRVMLTTRKKDVALRADQLSPPHEMRLLDDKEGWELFMKRIFPEGNSCPSDVEETGRQILAKCHGLPLAIAVLGGLLSTREVTLSEWSKVLNSVPWHLSESPDELCGEILALSYYDLPHYLKPCFLYLGLFPEDSEIHSKKLIRLWIAEGFVLRRGNEVLEDVAEDYLKELISRSMIQVASRRCNGSVRTCRIHDLLRDLSMSEAVKNNFFTIGSDIETNSPSTRVRRLTIYPNTEVHKIINRSTAALRSVLCFSTYTSVSLKITGKLIRVLDIEFLSGEKLPMKIGDFVHLRYFKFHCYGKLRFSISIGNLSHLQTLEIDGDGTLPNAIWNLERLRHLRAYNCAIDGPPRLNNLRNIQTLCLEAGSWIEDGLDKMTNLRKLGIQGSQISHHEVLSDSIEKLCSLQSLTIILNGSISSLKSFAHQVHLYKMFLVGQIEKLPDFPPNLAKLTLAKSQLKQDAIAILEKLPHLRILRLEGGSYCGKQMICSSEGFPQLEFLELKDGLALEEWIVEEGAMPSLKSVKLHGCKRLKTVPKRIRLLLGSLFQGREEVVYKSIQEKAWRYSNTTFELYQVDFK